MKFNNPWIDARVTQARPEALEAYLRRHGWKPKPYPRPQMKLFVEPHTKPTAASVVGVPQVEEADDYIQCVIDLITALALLEERPAVDVLNDVLQQTPAPQAVNGSPKPKKAVKVQSQTAKR